MSEPVLESVDGMFVGLLTEHELRVFNQAVADGEAHRSYENAAGFFGLAKVRLGRAKGEQP